jgi:sterol desaturase/sphingolipid hydroxylase (fatty acid hydroxylase superfamily)
VRAGDALPPDLRTALLFALEHRAPVLVETAHDGAARSTRGPHRAHTSIRANTSLSMQLTKAGYYADFVVYPLAVVAAATHVLAHASPRLAESWFAALLAGLASWSALEYVLHRWVLHRVPPFRGLHEQHHRHTAALIGTPTWVSAPLFVALWIALAREVAAPAAGGFTTGLMLGYLIYAFVHDTVHHRRVRPGSWLYRAKLRHARHHRPGANADFGVSTGLWDRIFATESTLGGPSETTPPR